MSVYCGQVTCISTVVTWLVCLLWTCNQSVNCGHVTSLSTVVMWPVSILLSRDLSVYYCVVSFMFTMVMWYVCRLWSCDLSVYLGACDLTVFCGYVTSLSYVVIDMSGYCGHVTFFCKYATCLSSLVMWPVCILWSCDQTFYSLHVACQYMVCLLLYFCNILLFRIWYNLLSSILYNSFLSSQDFLLMGHMFYPQVALSTVMWPIMHLYCLVLEDSDSESDVEYAGIEQPPIIDQLRRILDEYRNDVQIIKVYSSAWFCH